MVTQNYNDVVVKYLVEFNGRDFFLGSTKERNSGRIRLFLFFPKDRQIYSHNGLRGTWDKVVDTGNREEIVKHLNHARADKNVPCYHC